MLQTIRCTYASLSTPQKYGKVYCSAQEAIQDVADESTILFGGKF